MALYFYRARDTGGKLVSGTIESSSRAELIDKLRKMGYMTTGVDEVRQNFKKMPLFANLKPVSSGDMLLFYIQLSNIISAGIPILPSLLTMSRQVENKRLKDAIDRVYRQVEGGSSLSQAFAAEPRMFRRVFVNMIKAGEASGQLGTVLMRYAVFFEKENDLKEKIKGVLIYPALLLSAGLAVMLIIVTFVIPQFAEIYLKAGMPLPVPTMIVYNVGIAIKSYWYIFIAAAIGVFFAVKYYLKTEMGILRFDMLRLYAPVVGPLYRKAAMARFTRTLATLIGSGVPILVALDMVKDVVGNVVLARVIQDTAKSVERGERMSETLKISEEFPPDVIQMVLAGEETGALEGMLNKAADFYDTMVSYAVRRLFVVIEPLFLLIMGVMVGGIMASMLLPMFDMIKTLRH